MVQTIKDYMMQLAEDSQGLLSQAKLTMSNDVGMISINLPLRLEELQKIINAVHEPRPKLFMTIHGLNAISFIMERRDIEAILKNVEDRDVLTYREDLATIHISTPKTMRKSRGILSFVGMLMASNKISIEAGQFCEGDFVLVVEKHTATRAYELLMNSIDYMRKKSDETYTA